MGDRICMSISSDSLFDETLNRGPLALLLRRQYEFPSGMIYCNYFSNPNTNLVWQCLRKLYRRLLLMHIDFQFSRIWEYALFFQRYLPIEPKSVAMTSCVYSADGKALLAAGCDGVVRLYGEIFFICMILITYVTGAYTNNSPITDILAMVKIKKKRQLNSVFVILILFFWNS